MFPTIGQHIAVSVGLRTSETSRTMHHDESRRVLYNMPYTVIMIYDTNTYMPIFDILPSVEDLHW